MVDLGTPLFLVVCFRFARSDQASQQDMAVYPVLINIGVNDVALLDITFQQNDFGSSVANMGDIDNRRNR